MADKKLIAVVDYSMGNLRSVSKAAEHVAGAEHQIVITSDAKVIEDADAVIFPGQGAAKACMQALTETNMTHAIQKAAQEKPFLGICMGLQILMTHSTENNGVNCLDIIHGEVTRFDLTNFPELKLPHMGWNQIHQTTDHPLWHQIQQDSRFYFVHSYYVNPKNQNCITGTAEHGIPFNACLAQDSLFAIQAHPEKSAGAGIQLFKNFLAWNGQ